MTFHASCLTAALIALPFMQAGSAVSADERALVTYVDAHNGEALALLERSLALWDRVDDPERLAGEDQVAVLARAANVADVAGEAVRQERCCGGPSSSPTPSVIRAALPECWSALPAPRAFSTARTSRW